MEELLEKLRVKFKQQENTIETQRMSISVLEREKTRISAQLSDYRMEISRLKAKLGKFHKAVEEAGKSG